MKPLRVCIVPEYPISLMTGGLQVQAVRTFEALSASGSVDAELFDWSKSESLADVYHFVGFPSYLARITELVREAERPYVITLLFGSGKYKYRAWKAVISSFLNSRIPHRRSQFEAIIHAAQIVTITDADAETAHTYYGIDKDRIHVVPNGVAAEFFNSTPTAWHEHYGQQRFVLCVGAIQARKGQLLLARACNQLKIPLVLAGPILPGENAYAEEVEKEMQQNASYGGRWLQALNNTNPLLHSAYAACAVFALFSASETQPLSVMEAMAARKPILLLRAPYTNQSLFNHLPQVPTPDIGAAVESLDRIWNHGTPTNLPIDFTWPAVAEKLSSIYKRCESRRT